MEGIKTIDTHPEESRVLDISSKSSISSGIKDDQSGDTAENCDGKCSIEVLKLVSYYLLTLFLQHI